MNLLVICLLEEQQQDCQARLNSLVCYHHISRTLVKLYNLVYERAFLDYPIILHMWQSLR